MQYGIGEEKLKVSRMLYLIPISYILLSYSMIIASVHFANKKIELFDIFYIILILVVLAFNLFFPFFLRQYKYKDFLLKSAILIKYSLIPFYLIFSFILVLASFVLMLTGSLLWLLPWVFLYIMLLASSSYVIQFLSIQVKNYEITTGEMIIYLLGSIFFISDVITVFVLGFKEKYSRCKMVILLVTMLVVICLIIYVAIKNSPK